MKEEKNRGVSPAYTLEELSRLLHFTCLPLLSFEDLSVQKEVIQKISSLNIPCASVELGLQFKDKILSGYVEDLSIQWIHQKIGYGVFANQPISKGSYVAEYTGMIRRNDLRRCFESINDYCVVYPVQDEIGKNFFLDAKDQGNIARFMNHSYNPNLQFVYVFCEGVYHRILIAEKSIKKGEQLLYNYGRSYWHVRSPPLEIRLDEPAIKDVSLLFFKDFSKVH